MTDLGLVLLAFVYLMGMAARFEDLRNIVDAHVTGLARDFTLVIFCLIWPITMLCNIVVYVVRWFLARDSRRSQL